MSHSHNDMKIKMLHCLKKNFCSINIVSSILSFTRFVFLSLSPPSVLSPTGVFAVVAGLAAVVQLQLSSGHVLRCHRRPTGVSIEQKQGLVMALYTTRNYVFPLGPNL